MSPLIVALLLVACGAQATPAAPAAAPTAAPPIVPTEAPAAPEVTEPAPVGETPSAPEGAAGATYRPLDEATCRQVQTAVGQALGVETTLTEASFAHDLTGAGGSGCQIQATGTGEDFTSQVDVANTLTALFERLGWAQDTRFLADSATATAGAFRQETALCLYNAGWQPGPAVTCPADQPISACNVPPDQQIYTITVNCARE